MKDSNNYKEYRAYRLELVQEILKFPKFCGWKETELLKKPLDSLEVLHHSVMQAARENSVLDTIKLRQDVEHALDVWDERSLFCIGNVEGLTRADLDTLLMACDWFDAHGSLKPLRYFSLEIKRVLREYGDREVYRG